MFVFHATRRHTGLEIQDDLGMPVNYVRIQDLEDGIRKDIVSDKNSLHRAITPVLMLAHFFALLPVQGIKGQNTSYLVWAIDECLRENRLWTHTYHFFFSVNWFSSPVIYVFVVLSLSLLILSFSLLKIYQTGLTYYSTGTRTGLDGFLFFYFINFTRFFRHPPHVHRNTIVVYTI